MNIVGMVLTPEVIGAIEQCGSTFIVTFFQSALLFSSVVLVLGILFLTIVSLLFRDIILKWIGKKQMGYQPVGEQKEIKNIPEGGSGENK